MITLTLSLTFLISGIAGTLWFFLKPKGIVESAVTGREKLLKSLQDSSLLHLKRLEEMDVEIQGIKRDREKLEAMINSRLSSMEGRMGRQNKEDLRQEALHAIRTINQQ